LALELLILWCMHAICLKCDSDSPKHTRFGFFIRRSDQKKIQRYRCSHCKSVFSKATFNICYRQRKRKINSKVYQLLCSGVSLRRTAKVLRINRKTVVRKFLFLSEKCKLENTKQFAFGGAISELQFDDLETFEHSKLKPLSVTMAVEKQTRRILGFSVSQMPAKGLLARRSRKKYGVRFDLREEGRRNLFHQLQFKISRSPLIESDSSPHYPKDVKIFFPDCMHYTVSGGRSAITGQGELKKLKFDPLFTLNHTFAMFRANINRLFRKTWCTTKRSDRLRAHIELYVHYHNNIILT
jgi:transposase-like protein